MAKESKLMILAKVCQLKEKMGQYFGIDEYQIITDTIEKIPYAQWKISLDERGKPHEVGYDLSVVCSTQEENANIKIDYQYKILKEGYTEETDFNPSSSYFETKEETNLTLSHGLESIKMEYSSLGDFVEKLAEKKKTHQQQARTRKENQERKTIQQQISGLLAKIRR